MNRGHCPLCLRDDQKIVESHIISNFFYKPLKEKEGRFYVISTDPAKPDREDRHACQRDARLNQQLVKHTEVLLVGLGFDLARLGLGLLGRERPDTWTAARHGHLPRTFGRTPAGRGTPAGRPLAGRSGTSRR